VDEWKKTVAFAKQNRKEPTEEENIIWQELRNRQIDGFKFRRQHPIAGYIPDFVCLEKKLIVEIDGAYHNEEEQQKYDAGREEWLKENGFEMLCFTNNEINNYLPAVLRKIAESLSKNNDVENEAESGSPLSGRGVGGEVKRETSTMPGYAGSSWYFLRYMDPHNTQTFCDRKVSDYWNQVDLYIGGTEHAVGHLLYSRMWTKVLFDLGHIGYEEPFKRLLNQGMITGKSFFLIGNKYTNGEKNFSIQIIKSDGYVFPKEIEYEGQKLFANQLQLRFRLPNAHRFLDANDRLTKRSYEKYMTEVENPIKSQPETNIVFWDDEKKTDSGEPYLEGMVIEKMSKSKFNVENPDELCEKYGADTFRMYEMFLGPVEASKPWDTKGIEGVHRFLRKLWRLFNDDIKGKVWKDEKANDAELKILHRTIKKIEEDTEKFSFNTAVSAFMICVNDLFDAKCHKKEVLEKVLILLVPYAPHIAEELWQQLGNEGTILDAAYPTFNPALLVESSKEYPVSINGKVRTNINLSLDLQQADVEKIIAENEVVQKWLEGKDPKKIIYVKNKMINVVV
jgi:leucyl-tRNA synthetase